MPDCTVDLESLPDPYRFGDRIEQVIAHHARRTPHAPAVQQGDELLTYAQLVSGANKIAASLRRRGVGEGEVVPVLLERSCDLAVTLLGILSAGAAYIAMDTRWPQERIADVVHRSGTRLLVTDDSSCRPPGVDVEPYALLAATSEEAPPVLAGDGSAAACVFYTSGSTGRPKGVLSPHRGTIRTLVGFQSIPLGADTVFLQAAPLPWDGFALEMWAALLNGGRCVLLDRGLSIPDPGTLRSAIARGVNTLWLTSSLFNLLSDEAPELFGAIRLLLVGGERVSPAHVRRVLRRFPGLRVVNGYGPAENTIFTTAHPVRECDVADESVDVPLGKPVPRTGILLLDEDDNVEEKAGEIAVCGDGLALGYLADPEETNRRFVVIDGVRYYRTGDLAVRDDEGNLRYRGRSDRQLKINGVRVEPGEVDAVLEDCAGVATAYTLSVEPRPNRPVLAAVYTTRDGRPMAAAALREHAARRLIRAMVPEVLCQLAQLPLAATGKVDEAAARRIVLAAVGPTDPVAGHVPKDSDDELLDLVRDVLAAPELGEHDDFRRIGTSSLDIMRLGARLESGLGIRVTMAELYRCRTVGALRAHAITAPQGDSTPDQRHDSPLSSAQRRFWMAEQFSPGAMDSVIQLAYLVTGRLQPTALAHAWRDVVERHPVLRTIYPADDGVPVQQVLDLDRCTPLEFLEGAHGAMAADPELLARTLSDPWWYERFGLDAEPPVRARIVRIAADRHLFFLHAHHIAFDGWSESVFLDTLAAACTARSRGRRLKSREPAFSYATYGAWEAASVRDWKAEELPYWRHQLAETDTSTLPLAGRAAAEEERLEMTVPIPAALVERLRQTAHRHGGPLVAVFLAGVGRALNSALGMNSVVLGTTSAGRPTSDSQDAIGYFVNPVAVPLRQLGAPPEQVITTAVSAALGALSHARTPFDEVVRDLNPRRDRHPFFQVWAVLQLPPGRLDLGPDVRLRPIRLAPPKTSHELVVEALPNLASGWDVVVQWRRDGIDQSAAERLAVGLRGAFEHLADSSP
jgi:amino acid adenylation domain-containing protein